MSSIAADKQEVCVEDISVPWQWHLEPRLVVLAGEDYLYCPFETDPEYWSAADYRRERLDFDGGQGPQVFP
jgi:hypothetical protein